MTNHTSNTEQRERTELEAAAKAHNGDRKPKFGDMMRNPWAGETNPQRDGYFVRSKRVTGRFNPGLWYEMTDGQGKFWEINGSVALFREEAARATQAAPASPEPDYDALEREHLGDFDKKTGIYSPGRAPASPNTGAVTRLDVMSLIHSQMHRVYASAIDREDVDTKYMTEIEDAIMGIYHGRYIAGYDLRKSEESATPSPSKGGEAEEVIDSEAVFKSTTESFNRGWKAGWAACLKGGEAGAAAVLERAAQVCDQQADATSGVERTGWLESADAVRVLRDVVIEKTSQTGEGNG